VNGADLAPGLWWPGRRAPGGPRARADPHARGRPRPPARSW